MFKLFNWKLCLYAAAASFIIAISAFFIGHHQGVQQCNEAHEALANKAAVEQLKADAQAVAVQAMRSNDAGVALGKQAQSIQMRTQYLTKEVIKYVPIKSTTNESAGDCRIDPNGVRAWNDANRGELVAPAVAP